MQGEGKVTIIMKQRDIKADRGRGSKVGLILEQVCNW
jgi:hypothetical protein